MKTILVTGGTGFLGSHLCEKLLELGNYVICLDNNFTGSLDNIAHLRSNPNFEFIRHDVTKEIFIEVDQIYHLACPASPKNYQYNSIKTIKTNILGTLNMLGLAKRTKARILLTSTSEVYGDPQISPQVEEYWGNVNPIGIRSCYDEGKRLAETLMMEYHRNCGVDTRIVRIFNTYGPRLQKDDGRVVSNFIVQALQNKPITVYGDGSQTRSFCYVDDQINGLIKLMDSDYNLPVNIGNPHEITVKEIAEIIVKLTNSKSEIVYEELPKDDPTKRKPDITKARTILGWEPKVGLEEGLTKTIEYFKVARM
jgi:UDP-glucuronate decarboxylase